MPLRQICVILSITAVATSFTHGRYPPSVKRGGVVPAKTHHGKEGNDLTDRQASGLFGSESEHHALSSGLANGNLTFPLAVRSESLFLNVTKDIPSNVTQRRELLTQQASPDDWQGYYFYYCKGRRMWDRMQSAPANPPRFVYDELGDNGWVLERSIGDFDDMVLESMEYEGISSNPLNNPVITADLINPFLNSHGETLIAPQGSFFKNTYNPNTGTIVAQYNISPASKINANQDPPLDADALNERLPRMRTWADVVWAIWAHEAQDRAGSLRYIYRENIVNTITQRVMEETMGIGRDLTDEELDVPAPGHWFALDDAKGLALLGTPHGVGIAWLYINGKAALGARQNMGVGILADGYSYYLLFDLGQ
ncbi:MAG: hypothetical protein Q9219_004317 [cf. Caloplaca sp. 3 TL-2023]